MITHAYLILSLNITITNMNYEVKINKDWTLSASQKDEDITFRLSQSSDPTKVYEHVTDTGEFGGNIGEWDWSEDEYEVWVTETNKVMLICHTAASNGNGSVVFEFDPIA
jgi:hypothetical protein